MKDLRIQLRFAVFLRSTKKPEIGNAIHGTYSKKILGSVCVRSRAEVSAELRGVPLKLVRCACIRRLFGVMPRVPATARVLPEFRRDP